MSARLRATDNELRDVADATVEARYVVKCVMNDGFRDSARLRGAKAM